MNQLASAIAILAVSGAMSWLLMRPLARLGLKLGLVDLPSTRRTRARPVPTTGGILIFFAIAGSLLLALRAYGGVVPEEAREWSALLVGGTVIVLLGMIDDRRNLRPRVKLVVQVVVACFVVASGVAIEHVRFFVGPTIHLGWLAYPLTVFWLVGFMNAVNLIDGLDGLAAGIASIAAAGLFAVGLMNDNPLLYLTAAGLLGSTLGFLGHNFREGNIYLGDAGSMVLGFFLAGTAVVGAYNDGASNAVLVVGACMVVPAFDVVTTMLRRGRGHCGFMTPDRSHTHHRLIRFGLNPKMTVIVLWGVTLFFAGQALGFVSSHGLVYVLGSYAVAAVVARIVVDQHRKNVKTIASDFKDELLYLMGAPGARPAADTHEGMTLRELIVAQIRREALYRRMARAERRALEAAVAPVIGRSVGSGSRDVPAGTHGVASLEPGEEQSGVDDVVMEGEEAGHGR